MPWCPWPLLDEKEDWLVPHFGWRVADHHLSHLDTKWKLLSALQPSVVPHKHLRLLLGCKTTTELQFVIWIAPFWVQCLYNLLRINKVDIDCVSKHYNKKATAVISLFLCDSSLEAEDSTSWCAANKGWLIHFLTGRLCFLFLLSGLQWFCVAAIGGIKCRWFCEGDSLPGSNTGLTGGWGFAVVNQIQGAPSNNVSKLHYKKSCSSTFVQICLLP